MELFGDLRTFVNLRRQRQRRQSHSLFAFQPRRTRFPRKITMGWRDQRYFRIDAVLRVSSVGYPENIARIL
jgi:hypothetical protein